MKKIFGSILPSSFQPLFGGIGFGSLLYDLAQAKPSLDLRFAENKSLVDATTGAQLVTFTRASSGTFVGSDGVLQTAVTNFATFSQTLNNPAWVLSGTGATVTATADIAAPDGTMTAWTLTCGAGGFAQTQQVYIGISGVSYTGSFWIRRRSGTGTVAIRVSENTNTTLAGVTSDWQRFSFTATSTTTTIRLGIHLSGTSDAVDIWGAQLEQASTVGDYIPTTSTINSAPRFDHNPTTGESLGLLVEEQRTNLALQSEDFGTTWTTTNYVLTANAIASPSGTTTADKLVRDTVNASVQVTQNVTCVANTAHNFSCFVKAAELSKVALREGSATGNYVSFDLSTATVISTSGATGTITPFANGWYRVTLQMTTGAAQTTYGCRIIPLPDTYASGNPLFSFAGDGTSGIYLWGAQLEAGAFATSYIPTTTAAATRSADVASIEGTNFSSWYRQDEGTVFADGSAAALTGITGFVAINDSTNANRFEIRQSRYNPIVTSATVNVAWTNIILAPTIVVNTSYKQAAAFSNASHGNSIAGTLDVSSTAIGTIPATRLIFGVRDSQAAPTGGSSSTIKRIAFWPTRLGNATLQTITQ